MHADPVGTTTASMVIELHGEASRPLLAWMALTNPCVSVYLPVFVDAPVPGELMLGGEGGAWQRFKVLLGEVEKEFAVRAPAVRAFWSSHEGSIARDTAAFLGSLPAQANERIEAERDFAERIWRRTSEALDDLTRKVRAL
jgi:hypothetical protein